MHKHMNGTLGETLRSPEGFISIPSACDTLIEHGRKAEDHCT